jgi:cobalt-zinc-cadmium efflux system protein
VVIAVTGFRRTDAVVAAVIAVVVLPRAWHLLRAAVEVLMEAVPPGVDLEELRAHLLELEHVLEVHDLHASTVTSGLPVLTAHVVVEPGCFATGHAPQLLDAVQRCIAEHFDVAHSTVQLEPAGHAPHEGSVHA